MSDKLSGLTIKLKVQNRIQETNDTCSLVLSIPEEHKSKFSYQAGQFITLNLHINGETVARSYSLSSSPLADSDFKITIKKVEGGKASGYLVEQVKVGDELDATPPAGSFFKPHYLESQNLYGFAAGSGITPIFSILKTTLSADPESTFTLFYCSRFDNQIIFGGSLIALKKEYGSRLKITYSISKPSTNWSGSCGRITPEFIQNELKSSQPGHSFLCGPTEFMNMCENSLKQVGFNSDFIHRESFTIAPPKKQAKLEVDDRILIGDRADISGCEKVIAITNGERHELDYDGESNILELLINNGINAPYSCMDGACMACLGKVTEGTVYQDDLCILTDENVRDKETLTCQAKPLSKKVVIDYDDI